MHIYICVCVCVCLCVCVCVYEYLNCVNPTPLSAYTTPGIVAVFSSSHLPGHRCAGASRVGVCIDISNIPTDRQHILE